MNQIVITIVYEFAEKSSPTLLILKWERFFLCPWPCLALSVTILNKKITKESPLMQWGRFTKNRIFIHKMPLPKIHYCTSCSENAAEKKLHKKFYPLISWSWIFSVFYLPSMIKTYITIISENFIIWFILQKSPEAWNAMNEWIHFCTVQWLNTQ